MDKKLKYNENLVCKLYLSGRSIREVAKKLKGNNSSIAAIIKKHKISRKREPRKSTIEKNTRRCPLFSGEFLEYLDGLLISDGSLSKPSPNGFSSSYMHSSVDKEWLEEIKTVFKKNGIKSKIVPEKRRRKNSRVVYVLRTLSYDQFYSQYKRWYQGDKNIPRDIMFSKSFLMNWIYGDGTTGKSNLRLCCDSFSEDDINFILEFFKKNGFEFRIVKMGLNKKGKMKYRISLCKSNGLERFFGLLDDPLPCFEYKWKRNLVKIKKCTCCGCLFSHKISTALYCSRYCRNKFNCNRNKGVKI